MLLGLGEAGDKTTALTQLTRQQIAALQGCVLNFYRGSMFHARQNVF